MPLNFTEFQAQRELPEQRALFNRCFPENTGSSVESTSHYEWKFRKFPAAGTPAYEYAAHLDGALAGYYAAIPYRYSVNGSLVDVGMVCDVMTDPQQQGKGIFTKLGAYATENLKNQGIAFTTGYPIRPWVIPGHLKVGWKIAFKLPIYIRVLSVSAILRSKGLGFAAPVFRFLLAGQRALKRAFTSFDPSYRVLVLGREEFAREKDYEEFFTAWSGEQKNFLLKTKNFLLWRTGAPDTRYSFICLYRHRALVGMSITRKVELEKIPCLAILDLMVLRGAMPGLASLQEALADLARHEKTDLVVSMMSPTTASRLKVWRSGFIRSPKVFSLIIKKLSESVPDESLWDERNWSLFWIDSDDL